MVLSWEEFGRFGEVGETQIAEAETRRTQWCDEEQEVLEVAQCAV